MKLNQNLVYVTLQTVGGQPAMVITENTRAVDDIALSVGDVLSGTRAAFSSIVIQNSELAGENFLRWRQKQRLSIEACANRYGITTDVVRRYESQ